MDSKSAEYKGLSLHKAVLSADEIIKMAFDGRTIEYDIKDLQHALWSSCVALMNLKHKVLDLEANHPFPIGKCQHGWLYRIHSRNLGFGVFNRMTYGFTGIREKFGHEYLFEEYHHDTGAPYGTATPSEELEQVPVELLADDVALFAWLKEKEKQYEKPPEDDIPTGN